MAPSPEAMAAQQDEPALASRLYEIRAEVDRFAEQVVPELEVTVRTAGAPAIEAAPRLSTASW